MSDEEEKKRSKWATWILGIKKKTNNFQSNDKKE